MRLLQRCNTGEFTLTQVGDEAIPPYAILSHTWGADTEEVTFEDLTNGTGKGKTGYKKIRFCGEQARQDDLQYFWIDTCCINKANDAELSQALNSMFRWYRNATRCYVYLSDVSSPRFGTDEESNPPPWDSDFRRSKWFTRGWTLQELLAPASVEFFSQEGKRLGDKSSLRQEIYEITNISYSALQGKPLSQFSVEERLRWIEHRHTKLEEDKAYSLLGIFDVYILPIYGEGMASALARLLDEFHKVQKCIQDLRLTDPRDDKKRIEDTKGGLIEDSYRWILKTSEFQRWRNDQQSRLLWIKGDPGKGKTMLLCGITNELSKSISKTDQLSYFFCQATDSRINNAIAVLRGLLYLLVNQRPYLVSYIRKKYEHSGKALFEDANAWFALSEIFKDILQDPSLNGTYLTVDALDECVTDLPKLLDFILLMSSISSRAKWIVSSRNEAHIEQRLQLDDSGMSLSLELKENAAQVSRAVDAYIDYCLSELREIKHDQLLQDLVREKMQYKANSTFLWISLVIEELKEAMAWEVLQILEEVPTELKEVYRRMMEQIKRLRRQYPELCRQVLSTVLATYRPLHLQELHTLSGLPTEVQNVNQTTAAIVKMCGSFLTIREDNVYIIHQSASNFLSEEARHDLFPYGIGSVHQSIFARSLQVMSRTLKRDVYSLGALGYPIERVKLPDIDPLVASHYSCVYWIDHFHDWKSRSIVNHEIDLRNENAVDDFLRRDYLHWLEALSLSRSMSEGVVSMAKLEALLQPRTKPSKLLGLVQDARRFILYHKRPIENYPLQTYASALLFSPIRSLIRDLFKHEEPIYIKIQPAMRDEWSTCLQTLEGHSHFVNSVAFSHDSTRLVSASSDNTVKIWDARNGQCLQTFEGHSHYVNSAVFSHDSVQLASASRDWTVKIWDTSSGDCLRTLEGHHDWVNSVAFSHDSAWLASASNDRTIKIWDTSSGNCLRTLEGHGHYVSLVAFSHDSARLVSTAWDNTVKIWDASSDECLQTFHGHSGYINSVAFSHDSARLASSSWDNTVKIWDMSSGKYLKTLKGHSHSVFSVAFSHDSTRLASSSWDKTVKVWNASSGDCLRTLEGHTDSVSSVAFTHDSGRLASASNDHTVKIWDMSGGQNCQTLKERSHSVFSVALSHDSTRLASASSDNTVKIWNATSDECLQTLKGHSHPVFSVAFSHDSTRLVSASSDNTVKIWDARNGQCLQTFEGHSHYVNSAVFSHDSVQLASASRDWTVKIWDTSSGDCLRTLEGHHDWVNSVAFSHDSARLASASRDWTLKIWATSSGDCLQTLSICKPVRHISFDITDSYLHTEIGTIVVHTLSGSRLLPSISALCSPQYQGIALSADGIWITYNSKNLVWIPSEYRPLCSTVSRDTIGIGVGTGRVWTCRVERN